MTRAPYRSTLAAFGICLMLPALVLAQSTRQQTSNQAPGPPPQQLHLTTYAYDDAGRLTQVVYPDGTTLDYAYDTRSNVTDITIVP